MTDELHLVRVHGAFEMKTYKNTSLIFAMPFCPSVRPHATK